MHNSQDLQKVLELRDAILGGDEKRLKEQRDAGKLTARERIQKIADAGSFVELFSLVSKDEEGAGVITGYATIEERPVYIFAQDFTVHGGAMGQMQAAKIVKLLEMAQKTGAPVLAVMDSAGVRIDEGAAAMSAYSEIYQKMARMSGVCPMVALVLGPCIGGAALLTQIADVAIIAEKVGRLMVFGPQVMAAMNGMDVKADELGGAKVAAGMGACALVAADEDSAMIKAKQVLALLPSSNLEDSEIIDTDDMSRLLPAIDPSDVDSLVAALSDNGSAIELYAAYEPSVRVALARMGGRSVGLVAAAGKRSRVHTSNLHRPASFIFVGPTGVGKTEIARRLAKLVSAPFIKVEATKFTEVGYVGRDVESIIRDLVENAIRMVRSEFSRKVETRAMVLAEDRLVSLLVNPPKKNVNSNPFDFLMGGKKEPEVPKEEQERLALRREDVLVQLRNGGLEDREIEIEVEDSMPQLEVGGNSINIGDMMGGMMPKKTKIRRVKVKEARKILLEEESGKLIDEDDVREEAIRRAEQQGIVFIDEIDKVAGRSAGGHGPDVSREGVQRDILPIVEGSTVNTKYGAVRTDFMLFIAAGAFHVAKVTDLIPELQGRFPVHVTLKSLTQEDFKAILTQPENALTRQYEALLSVDKVFLSFEDSAIDAIAHAAYVLNETKEDIGARRLHAVFERLLEDISFNAGGDEMPNVYLNINGEYVLEHLGKNEVSMDMKRYIL